MILLEFITNLAEVGEKRDWSGWKIKTRFGLNTRWELSREKWFQKCCKSLWTECVPQDSFWNSNAIRRWGLEGTIGYRGGVVVNVAYMFINWAQRSLLAASVLWGRRNNKAPSLRTRSQSKLLVPSFWPLKPSELWAVNFHWLKSILSWVICYKCWHGLGQYLSSWYKIQGMQEINPVI